MNHWYLFFLGNIHVWQFPALCRHYFLLVQQNCAYTQTSSILPSSYHLLQIFVFHMKNTIFCFSLLFFTWLFPCILLLLPLILLFFHMHLPFSFILNHFFIFDQIYGKMYQHLQYQFYFHKILHEIFLNSAFIRTCRR